MCSFLPFRIARTVAETEGCGVVELKLAGNALQVSLTCVEYMHVCMCMCRPRPPPLPSPLSQYTTLVNAVSMLKESAREVQFDLAGRADYLDPEKLERTVYVQPLAANCTKEMVKVCACVHVYVCVCSYVHVYLVNHSVLHSPNVCSFVSIRVCVPPSPPLPFPPLPSPPLPSPPFLLPSPPLPSLSLCRSSSTATTVVPSPLSS